MAEVTIKPVETRKEQRQFVDFAWTLYRDDRNWIPPLRRNLKELVGFRKHPFHDFAQVRNWMAWRDGDNGWHHVDLGFLAGDPFFAPSRYYGGMSVDKNGNDRLFLARENEGTWHVEMLPIGEEMSIGDPVALASDSIYPLVRPYAVEGNDSVVWQRLISYPSYQDYSIQCWAVEP